MYLEACGLIMCVVSLSASHFARQIPSSQPRGAHKKHVFLRMKLVLLFFYFYLYFSQFCACGFFAFVFLFVAQHDWNSAPQIFHRLRWSLLLRLRRFVNGFWAKTSSRLIWRWSICIEWICNGPKSDLLLLEVHSRMSSWLKLSDYGHVKKIEISTKLRNFYPKSSHCCYLSQEPLLICTIDVMCLDTL